MADVTINCPVCEQHKFEYNGDFEICPVCQWQNDAVQNADPDYAGGANWLSLNQARANYIKHGVIMTEKDTQERKTFYQAHIAPDGTWIY